MDKLKLLIIMAAYNGETYIDQQIRSIQEQTLGHWELVIRDDGSSDSTVSIISKFVADDKRITLLKNRTDGRGVKSNFGQLIKYALSGMYDIVFFSDQDDVWLPDKLELFINRYEELIKKNDEGIPVLLHSDLQVVDSDLNLLYPSLMSCIGVKPVLENPLNRLLVQNYVTGCAMVCNRALLSISFPFPDRIVMHDWWLALCAAACGKIETIKQPTVMYRIHRTNQFGAVSVPEMCNPFSPFFREVVWRDGRRNLFNTFRQAGELKKRLQRVDNSCRVKDLELIDNFSSCSMTSAIKRLIFVVIKKIRPNNLFAVIYFYFRLIII